MGARLIADWLGIPLVVAEDFSAARLKSADAGGAFGTITGIDLCNWIGWAAS